MLRTITKHPVLWIATALVVALAFPAAAMEDEDDSLLEEEIDYSREGPYLGLAGVFLGDVSTDNLDVDSTGGISLAVGFRMVPELAMELAGDWAYLDGRNPWSVSVVTKLYIMEILDEENQGGRIQPYAVSNVGIISGELGKSKDPSANFKAGLGLDYWINEDLALVTQVVYNFSAGEATRWRTINVNLGVNWRY